MVDKQKESARMATRLGSNIAERRKHLDWTQDQLAERAGVDAETISRFERGVNLPSLPTLYRLAAGLQIEIGELLSNGFSIPNDSATKLGAWIDGLSVKDRRFVMNLVRNCCEHLRQKSR